MKSAHEYIRREEIEAFLMQFRLAWNNSNAELFLTSQNILIPSFA
jgi:hypothetical protein